MVTVSVFSPWVMYILASRFSVLSLLATVKISVELFSARVCLYAIHPLADSSIAYSKAIFDLTSICTSPPIQLTSNFDAVTVRASLCFWLTVTVLDNSPAFMTTDAERSSGVWFAAAVMQIVASPASPLVGLTEHQLSARLFKQSALQASLDTIDTYPSPPSAEKSTDETLRVSSAFGLSGVGSSVEPPLLTGSVHATIVSTANK